MPVLYLRASEGLRVRLDGPSLVVQQPESALRRFPLHMLSRIVVRGCVELPASVLRACGQTGVPVGIYDAQGDPVAFVLPWRYRGKRGAALLLEDFLARPDWKDRFDAWHKNQERVAIGAALQQCKIERCPLIPAAARTLLYASVERRMGASASTVLRFFSAQTAPVCAEALNQSGYSAEQLETFHLKLPLVRLMSGILAWRHYVDWSGHAPFFEPPPAETISDRVLTECWERVRVREERRARRLVEKLQIFIGDLEWTPHPLG